MATPLGTQWMGDSCTTTTTSNCKTIPWQEIILAYPSIISFLLRHFASEKINIRKLIKFMQNAIWYYSKIKLGGHWKNAIACVRYLFFSSNSKNYEKCFLFHLKTSFCIPILPFFLPVNQCFRGLLKIRFMMSSIV